MTPKLLAGCANSPAPPSPSAAAPAPDGGSSADLLKHLDTNFAGCDRHLTFQAGVGIAAPSAQMNGSIDPCKGE